MPLHFEENVLIPAAQNRFAPKFLVPVATVELKEKSGALIALCGSAQIYPHSEIRPAPV
jgi:hypothetical protein